MFLIFVSDVNECLLQKPCDQTCKDLKLGYKCACNDGYTLKSDNKTCEGDC